LNRRDYLQPGAVQPVPGGGGAALVVGTGATAPHVCGQQQCCGSQQQRRSNQEQQPTFAKSSAATAAHPIFLPGMDGLPFLIACVSRNSLVKDGFDNGRPIFGQVQPHLVPMEVDWPGSSRQFPATARLWRAEYPRSRGSLAV
jgi:hypothetical protein